LEPKYVEFDRYLLVISINNQKPINFRYDTENGISVSSSGLLKNIGAKEPAQVSSGSYSYTAPDGTPIVTNWVADEFGFRAEGDHLPKPVINRIYRN
jgi:hypothetical protein